MDFETQMQYIVDTIGNDDTKPTPSAWTKKDDNPNIPVNDPESDDSYNRYAGDIYALTNVYGPLYKGQTITITLQHLLKLAPRHRARTESYQGLQSYLRNEIGMELIIVSNKTKSKGEE